MNRYYVVILQSVRLDIVKERIELAEFARIGNARIFLAGKVADMWNVDYKAKEGKSPSVGTVFYHDEEQYRAEIFIQPRLVTAEEFGKANAPQT